MDVQAIESCQCKVRSTLRFPLLYFLSMTDHCLITGHTQNAIRKHHPLRLGPTRRKWRLTLPAYFQGFTYLAFTSASLLLLLRMYVPIARRTSDLYGIGAH